MLSKINTGTVVGLDGVLIEAEVDVANRGFPTFAIVGLPDKAVDEAKDRVRTAIVNTSFEMPDSRITVNLAPADIPKAGSGFDLPIAVGILAASGLIQTDQLKNSLFIGELSLEGNIRRVPGIISIVLMAREKGIENIFVPFENAEEASLINGITVFPLHKLTDLILHLNNQSLISPYISDNRSKIIQHQYEVDFSDVQGQEQAKRALEIAAAGMHNIHLKGSPGAGKTMLSKAFSSILPSMEKEELLDVAKIYSAIGQFSEKKVTYLRPFRSPHHTTSRIGLIGGGTNPMPGEISLAHRGVLFLDELPEFPRSVLEALRQPLEDGVVTISRASGSLTFPARFLLLAASNPCPCGYLSHPKKKCICSTSIILKYKKRLSGPLLDRIDLHVDVPPVDEEKLTRTFKSESSDQIRQRVLLAREKQLFRFKNTGRNVNSEMSTAEIKKYCKLTDNANELLKQAILRLSLSARSYFKVIKVSQTIADLENIDLIDVKHISEALQYRVKED